MENWLLDGWNPIRQGVGWRDVGHAPKHFYCLSDIACSNCDLRSQHCTSRKYVTSIPLAGELEENMVSVKDIRIAQYLLWRMGLIADGMLGWQQGFLINAQNSANFADSYILKVAVDEQDPYVLWLYSDDHDATEVPIYLAWVPHLTGRTVAPVFGCPQVGDVIEFQGNTVYSLNCRPMITAIHGVALTGNGKKSVGVRVDIDCSELYGGLKVHPWLEEGTVTARCWREAGARPMFLESTMTPPEWRGSKVCVNCKWDPTRSIGNFDTDGVAKLAETADMPERHYYCAARKWREFEIRYINETEWELVVTEHSPSRLADFAPMCSIEDCDRYAPIPEYLPFDPKLHFGVAMAQLVWPRDKGIETPPGAQSHLNKVCKRIGNPSLCSLTDMWVWSGFGEFALGDIGPVDQQEATKWQEHGGHCRYYEIEENDGESTLKRELGTFVKWVDNWGDYGIGPMPQYSDVPELGQAPPAARFGTMMPQFWTRTYPTCHLETYFPPRLSHTYRPSNDMHMLIDDRGLSKTPILREMRLWCRVTGETFENEHMSGSLIGGTLTVRLKPLVNQDGEEELVRVTREVYSYGVLTWGGGVYKCYIDLMPVWHRVPWLFEGERMITTIRHSPSPGAEVADYAQPIWYVDSENASFGHTGRAVRYGDICRNPYNHDQAAFVLQMIPFGGVVTDYNMPDQFIISRISLPDITDFSRADRCIVLSGNGMEWLGGVEYVEFLMRGSTASPYAIMARIYRHMTNSLWQTRALSVWPKVNEFVFTGVTATPPFCLEIIA